MHSAALENPRGPYPPLARPIACAGRPPASDRPHPCPFHQHPARTERAMVTATAGALSADR